MTTPNASLASNQIAFPFMSDTQQSGLSAAPDVFAASDANEAGERASIVPLICVMAAAGTVLLALLATQASEPFLITILASLAMLGVFFMFGLMAGHIRIGERIRYDDLVASFTENLETGLLLTGRDGLVHFSNRRFGDLIGRGPSGDALSLDIAFASEPAAAEAMFRLTRAASRGLVWREEFEVRQLAGLTHSDGYQTRHLSITCKPLVNDARLEGLGPLVCWTVTDTTLERAADLNRLAGLQAAAALYDQSPTGFLSLDANGAVRHANATFLSWIGRNSINEGTRALRLADVLSQDNIDQLRQTGLNAIQSAHSIDVDVTARNGRLVAMRFVIQRDAGGGLNIGVLNRDGGTVLSATEGAEVRFARLFETAPFGIAAIAADGTITSANAAFARVTLPGSGGVGNALTDVLAYKAGDTTRQQLAAALQKALTGQSNPVPVEITAGAQNEKSNRVYLSSLAEGRSDREAAIAFVLDATEQKELEAKFTQAAKEDSLGRMAGGMAHDFNNDLQAIIGYADLMLQTHRPTDAAYKDIKNIQASAFHAADMVRQLLSYSRRQTLTPVPFQLGEMIADNQSMLKKSCGKAELRTEFGRDLWFVKADQTQVLQVLLNLAVNAGHAMPNGGTLTVRTGNITERMSQKLDRREIPKGEYVMMEVEDTGTGMPPEVLAKIFEPYFTTKGVGKGTGLGLSQAYGFIKQSSGFIYADSQPGAGTTFRIFLPRYLPESEDEVIAIKERSEKSKKVKRTGDLTGSGRVLLVEDEDAVRGFASRALKRQGYEVLEASSGVEALEVMEANAWRVDLVVSDVVMPELDGPAMALEMRKTLPDLRIIFVSGYPREHFGPSISNDPNMAFLPKPFTMPDLAAKVKEQMGG